MVVSSSDETGNLYPGVRVSCQQDEALDYYWSFDSSINADVGTATMSAIGSATVSASGAKFGAAGLVLNGSSQALGITDAAGFKPTGDFTIGAWVKVTSAQARLS